MNIHFTNEKLFDTLNDNTIVKIRVGSHMYGLDNKNSDIDYLSIYLENYDNRNSFMWEHHQLQYKKNNIDFNFTTLQSFIRNALTGDSTINFEVLHSEDLKNSKLSWLYERRNDFRNYNIIKSYLGIAKRDHKFWIKDTNNFKNHTSETNKKLAHFVRGVIFAKNLFDNNFSLDLSKTTTFKICGYNDLELLDRIKNGILDYSFSELVKFFWILMEDTRSALNIMLHNREIYSFMDPFKLEKLDSLVMDFVYGYVEGDISYVEYNQLFYEVMENGLNYN